MSKNTVTKSQIDQILDTADKQEHVFWDKELVVSYLLPNGFSIVGRGACVDPANFDIEIGRSVARDDVENQLWKLEGYLLQQTLFQNGGI